MEAHAALGIAGQVLPTIEDVSFRAAIDGQKMEEEGFDSAA